MEHTKRDNRSDVGSRRNGRRALMRHSGHRSLKHCWYRLWTGLYHPKLLAVRLDEYVKARASGKCERARTIRVDRIGSDRSGCAHNRAVYADSGKRTDERSVSIEIDALYESKESLRFPLLPSISREIPSSAQSPAHQGACFSADGETISRHACGSVTADYEVLQRLLAAIASPWCRRTRPQSGGCRSARI
jgi:hypothetical protein